MYKFFGIAGKKGSGKDTVGRIIIEEIIKDCSLADKISFAEPLKLAICAMFGYTMDQLEDEVFKETIDPKIGKAPRYLMQALGTEYGRNLVRDDIWVLLAKNRVLSMLGEYKTPVITDVRFENEAAMIRGLGGSIIHVYNDELIDNEFSTHVSEKGIKPEEMDIMFYNSPKRLGLEPVHVFASRMAFGASKYMKRGIKHELRSW